MTSMRVFGEIKKKKWNTKKTKIWSKYVKKAFINQYDYKIWTGLIQFQIQIFVVVQRKIQNFVETMNQTKLLYQCQQQ